MTCAISVLSSVAAVAAAAACAAPTTAGAASAPPERALYQDGPSGRYLLEKGWSTRADPGDEGLEQGWQRPGMSGGFKGVAVPNAFNVGDLTKKGFRSRVQWYRVRFRAPSAQGASWKLRFESVNRRADVFLNGRKLGSHEGAYIPFELAAKDLQPGDNELVVRVDGRLGGGAVVPPGTRPRGWWNYGGLLREVYLRRTGALDVENLDVRTTTADPAQVDIAATVRNTTASARSFSLDQVRAEIEGPGQQTRCTAQSVESASIPAGSVRTLAIPCARIAGRSLWSPESPTLYSLRLSVPGARSYSTHFGIREWKVDEQGRALLNGRPLSLRGANFHEDTKKRGAALTPSDRDRLVQHLRALGADAARQHYPPHPALLEAFDRAGIVMWDEIPVWRWTKREYGSSKLRAEALRQLRQVILRDRNHASVMTWSISNEALQGGSNEDRYVRDAVALARRLDPTRLVSAVIVLSPNSSIPSYYSRLDAIGLNEYLGWYGTSTTDQLRPLLDAARAGFPRQALFVTEFGAESDRGGAASEKGTFAFQQGFLSQHLGVIDGAPYLSGAITWLLRDFPLRPNWTGGNPKPDQPFNHKGLISYEGVRKPAFESVRQRYQAVPATRAP